MGCRREHELEDTKALTEREPRASRRLQLKDSAMRRSLISGSVFSVLLSFLATGVWAADVTPHESELAQVRAAVQHVLTGNERIASSDLTVQS